MPFLKRTAFFINKMHFRNMDNQKNSNNISPKGKY